MQHTRRSSTSLMLNTNQAKFPPSVRSSTALVFGHDEFDTKCGKEDGDDDKDRKAGI